MLLWLSSDLCGFVSAALRSVWCLHLAFSSVAGSDLPELSGFQSPSAGAWEKIEEPSHFQTPRDTKNSAGGAPGDQKYTEEAFFPQLICQVKLVSLNIHTHAPTWSPPQHLPRGSWLCSAQQCNCGYWKSDLPPSRRPGCSSEDSFCPASLSEPPYDSTHTYMCTRKLKKTKLLSMHQIFTLKFWRHGVSRNFHFKC